MNIHKLNQKKALVKGKLIVGVDLAKRNHVAVCMLPDGVVVGKPLNVSHDAASLRELWKTLECIRDGGDLAGIVIAVEATGAYWEAFVRQFSEYSVDLVFTHGRVVKKTREMMDLSKSKNDPKDAYIIAQVTLEGKFSKIRTCNGVWAELRNLGLLRHDIMKSWVAWGNRIRSIQEKFWPERDRALKDCLLKTSLFLLEQCPFPEDIVALGLEGLQELVLKGSNNRKSWSTTRAIYQAAQDSIGVRHGQETARWELEHAIELFRLFDSKLQQIDQRLVTLLKETGYHDCLASIPGLSATGAALILAEIGDPESFTNAKEWVKLAGLNLVENQSGKGKREGRRISKVGRPVLRHVLYNLTIPLLRHNTEFRVHFLQLKNRGKHPMKAVVASMHKILRLTFALCRTKESYREPIDSRQTLERLVSEWEGKRAA